ncbi:protein argonaute-2-like [Dermacentor andersoni]|uniref:protein argonaute-2-like n=1 Tax=Dermacentor andersoni TaxID=34620 RepID=UPI0024163DCF|nr:protein argonaute-4-like [Dermacentor andersoni]
MASGLLCSSRRRNVQYEWVSAPLAAHGKQPNGTTNSSAAHQRNDYHHYHIYCYHYEQLPAGPCSHRPWLRCDHPGDRSAAPFTEDMLQITAHLPKVTSFRAPAQVTGCKTWPKDKLKIEEIQQILLSHSQWLEYGRLDHAIQLATNHSSDDVPAANKYNYDDKIFLQTHKRTSVPENRKCHCVSKNAHRFCDLLTRKYWLDLNNCVLAFEGRYTSQELNSAMATFHNDNEKGPKDQKVKVDHVATTTLVRLHTIFVRRVSVIFQDILQAAGIVLWREPSMDRIPVGLSSLNHLSSCDNSTEDSREFWFVYYTVVYPVKFVQNLKADLSTKTFYGLLPIFTFMFKFFRNNQRDLNDGYFLPITRSVQNCPVVLGEKFSKEFQQLCIRVTNLLCPHMHKDICVVIRPTRKFCFSSEDMSRCSVVGQLHTCCTHFSYPCVPHARLVYRLQKMCNTDERQCWKKPGKKPTSMIKSPSEPPTESFHKIYHLDQDAAGSIGQREFAIMITTETAHLVLGWPLLVFQNSFVSETPEGTWELWTCLTCKLTTLNWQSQLKLGQFGLNNCQDCFVVMLTCVVITLHTCIELLHIGTVSTNRKFVLSVLLEAQHKQADLWILVTVLSTDTDCNQTEQIMESGIFWHTLCNMRNNMVKMSNAAHVRNLCRTLNDKTSTAYDTVMSRKNPDSFLNVFFVTCTEEMMLAKEEKLSLLIAACAWSLFTRSKLCASPEDSVVIVNVELKDIKDVMEDTMKCFYSTLEHNFERKINYQADVRENHFMEGCNCEVSVFRLAHQKLFLKHTYEPGTKFIMVDKQHRALASDHGAIDQCSNMRQKTPAGSAVMHPLDFGFFLCRVLSRHDGSYPVRCIRHAFYMEGSGKQYCQYGLPQKQPLVAASSRQAQPSAPAH